MFDSGLFPHQASLNYSPLHLPQCRWPWVARCSAVTLNQCLWSWFDGLAELRDVSLRTKPWPPAMCAAAPSAASLQGRTLTGVLSRVPPQDLSGRQVGGPAISGPLPILPFLAGETPLSALELIRHVRRGFQDVETSCCSPACFCGSRVCTPGAELSGDGDCSAKPKVVTVWPFMEVCQLLPK